ncbi:unnamed protein product [Oppiella nova]|uniref:Carrier domain-containing protein n=1 Tax=Oppiella nova TaxID=334625 RepID=A0A7R9M176_9ACAR|nr:unnamed protein product [Oppiella nova]CAG2168830.1 unnamed protein product [Oppiella nova]
MKNFHKQLIHSCCDVLDKLLAINTPIVTSYQINITSNTVGPESSESRRLAGNLWRALGIDPTITPNHLTLGEIGLESMFAIEIQQLLAKQWNVNLTLNQLKTVTIGMFKEYDDAR